MPVTQITKRFIDQLVSNGQPQLFWDRDLKGFGVKVGPSGRKSYVVQYRQGGRGFPTKRITIGVDGSPWCAVTARAEAKRLLHRVGLGADLVAEAESRTRNQIDLRFDRFADKFLELYARREWSPATFATHASNIRRWLVPVLRSKPISDLQRRDVTAVLDRIPVSSAALRRNVFVLLRRMLNWAVERGEIMVSPVHGMPVPRKPVERHHIIADDDLIIIAAMALKMGPIWEAFFHLLILTGQRRQEVAAMSWAELSREEQVWTVPATRTKNKREHRVPLSEEAVLVLDGLAGTADWPRSGFVLSFSEGRSPSGFSKAKRRLDSLSNSYSRTRYARAIPAWRIHDIRRTVATNLQRIGVRFEVTEAILNHVSVTQAGVISVYQRHDWEEEKRVAMADWGKRFQTMIAIMHERENADHIGVD